MRVECWSTMNLAPLFCMTCTTLIMKPSVPPHTAITYTIIDIKQASPTISLVMKLAFLDTLFRADNLVFSMAMRDFLLFPTCSCHFKDWGMLIPSSFSVSVGIITNIDQLSCCFILLGTHLHQACLVIVIDQLAVPHVLSQDLILHGQLG